MLARGLADRRIIYLLVVSAGLAVFVGGKPFALLANTSLLLLGLTWLWVRLSLGNLSVYLEPERRVLTTSDRTVLRLRLNNEGFLPVPLTVVRGAADCRPSLDGSFCGRVPALGTSSMALGPLHLPRGTYHLGPVEIEVRDPLGIWRAETTARGDRVTVYPRVLPVDSPPVAPGRSFGRMRTRRPSQEDFSNLVEVRAFQPGDNPRLIDWKATARRGSWQVRVLEEGAVPEVWIFLDASEEAPVEVAASLARWLLLGGAVVGLVGQGNPPVAVMPGRGESKWREIMQGLLRVQRGPLPLGEVLGVRLGSLPRGCTLLAITPRLDGVLFDGLLRARGRGLGAYLVLAGESESGETQGDQGRVAYLGERGLGVLRAHLVGDPLRWRLTRIRQPSRREAYAHEGAVGAAPAGR